MNKAFMKEPDPDGAVLCPRCGTPGSAVGAGPLNTYILPQFRSRIPDVAWYCGHTTCDVAYFSQFEQTVLLSELAKRLYPYDIDAPICACFGFGYDDVDEDVQNGEPSRIRELLKKSRSPEAHCATLAADGQCCLKEIQRLYLRLRSS